MFGDEADRRRVGVAAAFGQDVVLRRRSDPAAAQHVHVQFKRGMATVGETHRRYVQRGAAPAAHRRRKHCTTTIEASDRHVAELD